MKAAVYNNKSHQPEVKEMPEPKPKKGEELIEIKYAALNHRDVWISQGLYPKIKPAVGGSDGSGILNEKEVLINPSWHWGESERVQSEEYQVLGMPVNGTFAEYCQVPVKYIHPIPAHLDLKEAAALPLAGLTAYRAVMVKGNPKPGDKILISGIGGGVALFALQFAVAAGCDVYVTSSSDQKINKAIQLGAKNGFFYTETDWKQKANDKVGFFDLIIDGAAGKGFSDLVSLAAPGGKVVVYGGTAGKIPSINPYHLFWRQVSIYGTTMGSDKDFEEMLEFVRKHEITPVVDKVFSLKEIKAAFEYMDEGAQFGKILLEV